MKHNNNSEYLSQTLKAAKKLQERYNNLNAPSSQRVRNPIPMHQIIMQTLPIALDPDAIVKGTETYSYNVNGKTIKRKKETVTTIRQLMGLGFLQKVAIDKYELNDQIIRQGFTSSVGTVAMTLSQLKLAGLIGSIPGKRKPTQLKGKAPQMYFRKEVMQSS